MGRCKYYKRALSFNAHGNAPNMKTAARWQSLPSWAFPFSEEGAAKSPGAATLRLRIAEEGVPRGTEPAGRPSLRGRPIARFGGIGVLGSRYFLIPLPPLGRPGPRFTVGLQACERRATCSCRCLENEVRGVAAQNANDRGEGRGNVPLQRATEGLGLTYSLIWSSTAPQDDELLSDASTSSS